LQIAATKEKDKIFGKLLEKKQLEDQRVDCGIILRWILGKCNNQAQSLPD
jgi:hypothetical protein